MFNCSAGQPRGAGISLEPTVWYNPEQRTAVYVVPGLVGVILTMTMVMLTAMAVVRERERGTLEALIVSPARPCRSSKLDVERAARCFPRASHYAFGGA